MTTSEMNLIEEFWQKFDSCYVVYNQKIPKRFYLFYDEKFIRQKKLSRVLLQEVQYPTEIVGKCLFRMMNFGINFLFNRFNVIFA